MMSDADAAISHPTTIGGTLYEYFLNTLVESLFWEYN